MFLICATASNAVVAEDLLPGLWEISMESRVPAESGWTPAPFSLTQCLTASDAKEPSRMIGSLASAGASGCSYTEKSYSGSTFRFALNCSGAFNLKTSGSITFSANSFDGTIIATGNMSGQTAEFQNRVSARRVGGC